MLLKVLIILLPILCDGEIQINIIVASHKNDVIIQYSGYNNKLVTEHEVKLFNISITNLNRGFRVELGKVPDGIFLKDPTTYGNLFHKYKWPEVHRHLQVDKIEVTEIINKQVDLKTSELENNSIGNSKTDRSLYERVENNVYSTWPDEGMPDEETFYNVTIKFGGSNFRFETKWRNNSLRSKFVKLGKTINGNLTIKPGQTFVKKLTATKTILVLKIDYKARLIGNLIGDYENLYGKYHFWAPTIENIMKAAKIPNEIRTSERMEIRCYTDPKLNIFDKDTGLPVPVRIKRRLFWKPKKWFIVTTEATTVPSKQMNTTNQTAC